jgi:serine protease Do
MKRSPFSRVVIAGAVVAALAGAGHLAGVTSPGAAQAATPVLFGSSGGAAAAPSGAAVAAPVAMDFSAIVERYGPAVVNISVTGKAQAAQTGAVPGLAPDDPMNELFKRFGPRFRAPGGGQMVRGQGSGFIVSADGLILTNAHVVADAQQVTVRLTDRREFSAKVLGSDPQTDVAVIRIDAKNLPTVRLGDPGATRVGEPVLAIGSPFGFESSASAGIVSAKARALPDDNYVPFIQTDVAVNPGNSGGPLFNARGEVIGINSQIYSRTGGYQGLSFAIPIDVASKVQAQLVATGKVTRGRLGIAIQDVNASLADAFGLARPAGALVASVERGSPAERAGLEAGDVIVKLNGAAIDRSSDLPTLVADLKPGASASLEVIRKGAHRTLVATVGESRPEKLAQAEAAGTEGGRLGVAVRPLERDEKRQSGIAAGLVVEQVSGPAARAGLQPGDVILACNGTPVASVEQLKSLVGGAKRTVALLIERDQAKIFVPVELG